MVLFTFFSAGFISHCRKYKAAVLLSRLREIGQLKTALARYSEERSFFILNCRESAKVYILLAVDQVEFILVASYAALLVMCFFLARPTWAAARKHFLLLFFRGEQFNFEEAAEGVCGARLECIEKWSHKGQKNALSLVWILIAIKCAALQA